jgi:hypothetical protein
MENIKQSSSMIQLHERWGKIYEYLCSSDKELVELGLTILLGDEECWRYTMTKISCRMSHAYINYVYLGTLDTKPLLESKIERARSGTIINKYCFNIEKKSIDIYINKEEYFKKHNGSR